MKYLIFLFLLLGCSKEHSFENSTEPVQEARNTAGVFPTSVNLGPDITLYREFSTCVCRQSVYLSTCGVEPQFEAPNKGYRFYQISGPNQAGIDMGYSSPILCNMTYGTYTFVGHAWVTGYAACMDSVYNDNVYDTIKVTVSRKRK